MLNKINPILIPWEKKKVLFQRIFRNVNPIPSYIVPILKFESNIIELKLKLILFSCSNFRQLAKNYSPCL